MSEAGAVNDNEPNSALLLLGKRLREARGSKRLSPEQAEEESCVKASTIRRYERGKAEPGALKLAAMAKVYGVSCDWLLGLRASPASEKSGQAVVDLDQVGQIEAADSEEEIDKQLLWKPPPFLAVIALPLRKNLVSLQQAIDIGSGLLAKVKSTGPRCYARWVSVHSAGG